MPRLESIEKAGFYAFDPAYHAALVSLFSAEEGARLLDPCAGEGAVLKALHDALPGSAAYANELDSLRSAACKQVFGPLRAVQGDLYRLRASGSAFSLLWVNPPYSWDTAGRDKRREFDMLSHAWKWVQPGGYVAWCVYSHHVTKRAAQFLCKWADQVDLWRIPGLHLGAYPQVVVVARASLRKQADWEERSVKLAEAATTGVMRELAVQDKALYRVPSGAALKRSFIFSPDQVTPEFAALALEQSGGAHSLAAFQGRFAVPPAQRKVYPVIKPRGGQLAMMLAAGAFESLTLTIDAQVTGVRATIDMVDELKKVIAAKDEDSEDIGVYHTKPEVTVALLTEAGKLTYRSGDEALLAFIREHKSALLAYVEQNFEPQYRFQLPPDLRSALDKVRIKGNGLFEVQKHIVGALHASLDRNRAAILVGEQGVGKTVVCASLAATTALQPGQVSLVLCPPHLTYDKWLSEASQVMPGGFVKVLEDVDDVAAFFKHARELPASTPKLGILSFTSAKLNETWKPAALWQHDGARTLLRLQRLRRWRKTLKPDRSGLENRPLRLAALWRYHAGSVRHEKIGERWVRVGTQTVTAQALPGPLDSILRTHRVTAQDTYTRGRHWAIQPRQSYRRAWWTLKLLRNTERLKVSQRQWRLTARRQVYLDLDKLEEAAAKRLAPEQARCPSCGAPLYQGRADKDPVPMTREYLAEARRCCGACQAALWQEERQYSKAPANPRTALARLIAKRYADQVGLVIFDEAHELKGRESAQGQAMLMLATVPRVKVVLATGTLSNGLASGLYVLMFAVSPSVRKDYPWGRAGEKDASRGLGSWCKRMGRLEKMFVYRGDEQQASGSATGVRRQAIGRPREIPGTTPYLVAEILDRSIFVGLSDLGTVMPPYVQSATAIPMDEDMADAYKDGVDTMKGYLTRLRREGDNTFAGAYRQSALSWPNAAFRAEVVQHGSLEVCTLPSLGIERVYPKEQALLDLLRDVIARGERAVVFLRQTGTRDIQPRLESLIRAHVPLSRPYVLSPSVPAKRRMVVVNRKTAEGVNVLISNARRLQTGVDLLDYRHIIFVEFEDSYQTVGQSSRRHWRVGQKYPCYTHYFFYTADGILTMEHSQVIRTAKKEVAASLLYGEPATEGLAEADQESDDTALVALVDEFARDRSIQGTRDLFAAVNERRNTASESAWQLDGPGIPAAAQGAVAALSSTGALPLIQAVEESNGSVLAVKFKVVQLSLF